LFQNAGQGRNRSDHVLCSSTSNICSNSNTQICAFFRFLPDSTVVGSRRIKT
jgi:hypothetical protein